MDLSLLFPAEAVLWVQRYGLFTGVLTFGALGLALLLRPLYLWYSGKTELLDRLRRLEETNRQSLLQMEILNQTLSIPLRKAGTKAPPAPPAEAPLIVTQETKEGFLQALARSRKAE